MTELFEQALGEFNAHMGTTYTSEDIELVPITRRNGVRKKNAVIERLHARNKSVSSPSAFSYLFGEAIIGMDGDRVSGKAAILFRTDLQGWASEESILMHELSHVFAITREYGGRWFPDHVEADDFAALSGYGIWKEFIANYIASQCADPPPVHLNPLPVREKKMLLKKDMDSHDDLSRYLCWAVCTEESKSANLDRILEEKHIPFPRLIKLLAEKVREENYWEIKIDLMEELGNQFIVDKAMLAVDLSYEDLLAGK